MSGAFQTRSTATPSTPPLPTLRTTRVEDYPQIQKLESAHGLLTLSQQDWRGLWLDNPLWKRLGERWPIGWVLEDSAGRIVGSLANIPTLYTLGGRELIAATGRAWVNAKEYRGVALWLMDEYFHQARADLLINSTVNALAVEAFGAFGSARVPLGDWEQSAFWITHYRGFAKTALRIKNIPLPGLLAYPAAVGLKIRDLFKRQPLPPGKTSMEISQSDHFDDRFDAFWMELVKQNPEKLLAVRDRQTLSWHFGGPMRAGELWIFTASRGGLLRAYCVLKRQDHPASGLVRMRLVDHQTLDPDEGHLSAMLGPALRRCASEGIYILEHVGCDLPKMREFDRGAPYRRKLGSWPFYYSATDHALHAELARPEHWDPSSYDGDASL
jgi:hypothetical protein